ncbi:MAG: hypothetical protein R6U57_05260 [Anaerolineales bacterium]
MLKSEMIDKVSKRVYRKFPDFEGVKPKVKKRPKDNKTGEVPDGYLLLFQTKVSGPGGKEISRIVRAVTDKKGNIEKLSTSK